MPPAAHPDSTPAAAGLQPARVWLHTGFGAFPLAYYLTGMPRSWMLALSVTLALAFGLLDAARLVFRDWNRWVFGVFGPLLRAREAHRLSGASFSLLALVVAVWAFPPPIVAVAFLYHSIGDVAASWVGRRWGRQRIRGKSLEGTAAFVLTGSLAAWPVVGAVPALLGAASAGAAELVLPLDDNLVVPLAGGGTLVLLATVMGGA